jgi:hypothetical protein
MNSFEINEIQEEEPGCAAQEFRLASKLTDTMGKPANQPFNLHMCIVA